MIHSNFAANMTAMVQHSTGDGNTTAHSTSPSTLAFDERFEVFPACSGRTTLLNQNKTYWPPTLEWMSSLMIPNWLTLFRNAEDTFNQALPGITSLSKAHLGSLHPLYKCLVSLWWICILIWCSQGKFATTLVWFLAAKYTIYVFVSMFVMYRGHARNMFTVKSCSSDKHGLFPRYSPFLSVNYTEYILVSMWWTYRDMSATYWPYSPKEGWISNSPVLVSTPTLCERALLSPFSLYLPPGKLHCQAAVIIPLRSLLFNWPWYTSKMLFTTLRRKVSRDWGWRNGSGSRPSPKPSGTTFHLPIHFIPTNPSTPTCLFIQYPYIPLVI